jgi:hypothetical protein
MHNMVTGAYHFLFYVLFLCVPLSQEKGTELQKRIVRHCRHCIAKVSSRQQHIFCSIFKVTLLLGVMEIFLPCPLSVYEAIDYNESTCPNQCPTSWMYQTFDNVSA